MNGQSLSGEEGAEATVKVMSPPSEALGSGEDNGKDLHKSLSVQIGLEPSAEDVSTDAITPSSPIPTVSPKGSSSRKRGGGRGGGGRGSRRGGRGRGGVYGGYFRPGETPLFGGMDHLISSSLEACHLPLLQSLPSSPTDGPTAPADYRMTREMMQQLSMSTNQGFLYLGYAVQLLRESHVHFQQVTSTLSTIFQHNGAPCNLNFQDNMDETECRSLCRLPGLLMESGDGTAVTRPEADSYSNVKHCNENSIVSSPEHVQVQVPLDPYQFIDSFVETMELSTKMATGRGSRRNRQEGDEVRPVRQRRKARKLDYYSGYSAELSRQSISELRKRVEENIPKTLKKGRDSIQDFLGIVLSDIRPALENCGEIKRDVYSAKMVQAKVKKLNKSVSKGGTQSNTADGTVTKKSGVNPLKVTNVTKTEVKSEAAKESKDKSMELDTGDVDTRNNPNILIAKRRMIKSQTPMWKQLRVPAAIMQKIKDRVHNPQTPVPSEFHTPEDHNIHNVPEDRKKYQQSSPEATINLRGTDVIKNEDKDADCKTPMVCVGKISPAACKKELNLDSLSKYDRSYILNDFLTNECPPGDDVPEKHETKPVKEGNGRCSSDGSEDHTETEVKDDGDERSEIVCTSISLRNSVSVDGELTRREETGNESDCELFETSSSSSEELFYPV